MCIQLDSKSEPESHGTPVWAKSPTPAVASRDFTHHPYPVIGVTRLGDGLPDGLSPSAGRLGPLMESGGLLTSV
jgi:hypothetical protein